MQTTPVEIWYTLLVGTFVLLTLAVGLISTIISSQRRFIASQREQLQQITSSEQKYRNLFENSLVGMVRISLADWSVMDANTALLRMLHDESFDEVKLLIARIPMSDQVSIKDQLLHKGTLENFETHLKRSDGSSVWVSISGKVLPLEEVVEGVVIDISGRKEAEERIREQAALLDKAQDAIMLMDLDDRVVYWNKSSERLYGWQVEEALGKPVTDLIYKPEASALVRKTHQEVMRAAEWKGELHQITKAGNEVICSCRWTLVRDADGNPKSILMVNTDITEKKLLEAQFLRAQRMESIGVLAGGIAHDLNNILSPIIISIQMLRKKTSGDNLSQKVLSAIDSSARRGAAMVKQVLTFARGIEGERSPIEAMNLIGEVFKIASQTFPKNIDLVNQLPQTLWPIVGDPTQLHQVFMNLFVNARDAMPNGGKLTVRAVNKMLRSGEQQNNPDIKDGPYVVIHVSDTGMGIPQANKDKIFEPFFTTKDIGKGTGLGLSTVLGIVKSHGGSITLDSFEGRGTTFNIFLPALLGNLAVQKEDEEVDIPLGHGEVVLIVDDEEALRLVAKATLENYGYRVLEAMNGMEAVAMYKERGDEINVVLTDLMMPEMGGADAIKVLQEANPNVKIIATSGFTIPEELRPIKGGSVRAVLPKPFTAEKLLLTLDTVIKGDR